MVRTIEAIAYIAREGNTYKEGNRQKLIDYSSDADIMNYVRTMAVAGEVAVKVYFYDDREAQIPLTEDAEEDTQPFDSSAFWTSNADNGIGNDRDSG